MTDQIAVYELTVNARWELQGHALSNAGKNGTNRTLGRRQLLASGIEVDAISGNIAKNSHARLLTEYCEERDIYVCPACGSRDQRRAAAYKDDESQALHTSLILKCGVCDAHGYLITPKNATEEAEARERLAKHTLVDYSLSLALPSHWHETPQLHTRTGTPDTSGQMIMKQYSRSGYYAVCIRYKAVGIGMDTDVWKPVIVDEDERLKRHQAILSCIHDLMLSPTGATTSKMLPHLTGLSGAVMVRKTVGRAPLYSPLASDFQQQLAGLANADTACMLFDSVADFSKQMQILIQDSRPYTKNVRMLGDSK